MTKFERLGNKCPSTGIDDGGEGWIQEVHPDEICEMFKE